LIVEDILPKILTISETVKPFIPFISAIISYITSFFLDVGYLLNICYLRSKKTEIIFLKMGKFILHFYPTCGIIIYR
jgi:hypothetical protein